MNAAACNSPAAAPDLRSIVIHHIENHCFPNFTVIVLEVEL